MTTTERAAGTVADERAVLLRYLTDARESLVWKLDGLSERDARWPTTPTGTNLLGLVKHATSVEIGYFGPTFGRAWTGPDFEWMHDDAPVNADMWATAQESVPSLVELYRSVWAFADELLASAPLDLVGQVPWWPAARAQVTLREVVVHVTSDLTRHAGHADIVRELLDGAVGLRPQALNVPEQSAQDWADYVRDLRALADSFATTPRGTP